MTSPQKIPEKRLKQRFALRGDLSLSFFPLKKVMTRAGKLSCIGGAPKFNTTIRMVKSQKRRKLR